MRLRSLNVLSVTWSFIFLMAACSTSKSGSGTGNETAQWLEGKQWLNGFQRTPDKTIDQQQLKAQYDANPQAWNKAFAYLKETNLATLATGKHVIDGENIFALVTQGPPKNPATAAWECHKNYIDIHCVILGREKNAIAPVTSATVTVPYDFVKDIGFYTAKGKFNEAGTENFFVIFPGEAHCPGVKVEGYKEVKKIVIKIKKAA